MASKGCGEIPGLPGEPAFHISEPEISALPVLIAAPHGGRAYPSDTVKSLRHPTAAPLRLEDRLADRLASEVAGATGAALLYANAPRALIDLNRDELDVDWGMITGAPAARRRLQPAGPGMRARGGLGLVPRRVPGLGELWRHPLDYTELQARIRAIHRPYHRSLGTTLEAIEARWGAALLVDLHSMPPLTPAKGAASVARVVVGDRFGASCDGLLIAATFSELAADLIPTAHNRPYSGGYVLERHARPERGIHAIQLEIDRTIYLDGQMRDPGPGFANLTALLIRLVRKLGAITAEVGAANRREWSIAAQ